MSAIALVGDIGVATYLFKCITKEEVYKKTSSFLFTGKNNKYWNKKA